jgi:hypothetical protein
MGTLDAVTGAELDRLALGIDTSNPLTSPVRQLAYMNRRLSPFSLGLRLGLKPATIHRWFKGAKKPGKKSIDKLGQLYRETREKEVLKKNRRKLKLGDTAIQISGTISFSDTEEYRDNFGKTPVIASSDWRDVIAAWQAGGGKPLHEAMQTAIQSVTTKVAFFPADDYELDIQA